MQPSGGIDVPDTNGAALLTALQPTQYLNNGTETPGTTTIYDLRIDNPYGPSNSSHDGGTVDPVRAIRFTGGDSASGCQLHMWSVGSGGNPAVYTPPAGVYNPLTPTRVLDTRYALGAPQALAAGGTLKLAIAGLAGMPTTGVTAVALNLTVLDGTSTGAITTYADGTSKPGTSTIDWSASHVAANTVITTVGADGVIDFTSNSPGTVDLIADVVGYYNSTPATTNGAFVPVTPTRLLDTRYGTGARQGPIAANGSITVTIAGVDGIPSTGVEAVLLNLTVPSPPSAGNITAYPTGNTRPGVTTINWPATTSASMAVVPVTNTGKIDFYSFQTTDLIGDVIGYYTGTAPQPTIGGSYIPVATPNRVLDTRYGTGVPQAGAIASGGTVAVPASTSTDGVPNTCISAIVLTLAVTGTQANGDLVAYADGTTKPGTSNLNYAAGQTISNLVIAPVGADGKADITNNSSGTTHIIGDIAGYYPCTG